MISVLIPSRNVDERKAKRLAYIKKWKEDNPDKVEEYNRRRRGKHKEEANRYARDRYPIVRDKALSRHRIRKYNLDDETYKGMVDSQGCVCLICGKKPDINLSVDHDHLTGKVRGLLCNSCNVAIAHAHDSPEILRAMADYLEKYR